MPDCNDVYILTNTQNDGGSADVAGGIALGTLTNGYNGDGTVAFDYSGTAIHEISHIFARLADTYSNAREACVDNASPFDACYANITNIPIFEQSKFYRWQGVGDTSDYPITPIINPLNIHYKASLIPDIMDSPVTAGSR